MLAITSYIIIINANWIILYLNFIGSFTEPICISCDQNINKIIKYLIADLR